MPTLYSILALPAFVTGNLKYIAIGAAALVVLIAFIVGCVQGFSRMGWGALFWGCASALFIFVELKFHEKNPVLQMGAVEKLPAEIRDFVGALSVAIAAILVASVVFGLLAFLVRPRRKRDKSYYYCKEVLMDANGNDDGDDDYREQKRVRYAPDATYKPRKVSGFNRFVGGLVAVVQTAIVLAGLAGVALVIVKVTPFASKLSFVYASENATVAKIWGYVRSYALDLVWIALIAGIAVAGFKAGFLRGFAGIFKFFGIVAAIAFLAVPFVSALTSMKAFAFVARLSMFYANGIGKIEAVAKLSGILGKVACGVTLAILCGLAVTLVCWLLRLIARAARRGSAAFRFLDGVVAFFVMLAVGVAVCLALTTLLYLPESLGKSFVLTDLFGDDSALAKGFYDFVVQYVKPLIDKIKAWGK